MSSQQRNVTFEDIQVGKGALATREHKAIVSGTISLHRGEQFQQLSRYEVDLKRRYTIAGLRYGIGRDSSHSTTSRIRRTGVAIREDASECHAHLRSGTSRASINPPDSAKAQDCARAEKQVALYRFGIIEKGCHGVAYGH
jgi:hypothetical protein